MPRPALTPADVLATMLRTDPAAPRLTYYDDQSGERIELSAKTLANWVAKAANLLADELDAGPDVGVGLDLPAHWRTAYWALAAWSVGATVAIGAAATRAPIVVSTDPQAAAEVVGDGRAAVLVTLAALARRHPDAPAGAIDEARELASHPDVFTAAADPDPESDVALIVADEQGVGAARYGELLEQVRAWTQDWPPTPRVHVGLELESFLTQCLAAWDRAGSVVVVRHPLGSQADRLAAERVTVDLGD